ncbi:MAG: hypothetical protein ACLVEX_08755 [Ruthenibacterium lactatiformans]
MGKSFLNKKIIKFLRMFGVKVYIFDPEGEYGDLVHQMGGTVINRARENGKTTFFRFVVSKVRMKMIVLVWNMAVNAGLLPTFELAARTVEYHPQRLKC